MHQHQIAVPLPGPHCRPKNYLKEYKFQQPLRLAHRGLLFVSGAIFFAFLCIGLILTQNLTNTIPIADATMALIALGALIVGYEQWRAARHESAMEKYYDRLDIPNRRRESAAESVRKVMRHTSPDLKHEDQNLLMYVCLELDNLEYVVEKYKVGYIKHEQACRGLRTFQQRCLSPEFRRLAKKRVRDRDYHPSTIKVVKKVCRVIDRLERQRSPERLPSRSPGVSVSPPALWMIVISSLLAALAFKARTERTMAVRQSRPPFEPPAIHHDDPRPRERKVA